MVIAVELLKRYSERWAAGETLSEVEEAQLRGYLTPQKWLDLCRQREAAISAPTKPGDGPSRQLGPMPETTQVRLKIGGPVMMVEDIRESEKLVQCLWFDDAKHVQRDAFHKDALEAVPLPTDPSTDTVGHMWRQVAEGQISDAQIDQVACEIYRAQCEDSPQRFQMPAWMTIGEDARNTYRKTARQAWKAFLELR